MARQTAAQRKAAEQNETTAPEASTTDTNQEVPVTEQTVETPAEGTDTPQTEAPAEAPIDLGPFQTVVAAVVETRDSTTGELNADEQAKTKAAYNELDGVKPKNAAKKWVEGQMMEAVNKLDGQLARAFAMVTESLVADGKKSGGTSTPADPTAAYVAKRASLLLATSITVAGAPQVEGRDLDAEAQAQADSLAEQVTAYRTWLDAEVPEGTEKPDAPEVSPVVRAAFKLATGKASGGGRTSGGSGPRADIAKHVAEAFAEHPVGHVLKVSEIANFKSSEYPNGNASQGAISARLFPPSGNCTLVGIEPVEKDASGPRRARKSA